MKSIFILSLASIIFFTACKKEYEQNYVKGDVLFVIQDTVSFYSTQKMFQELNLSVEYVHNYEYRMQIPEDSVIKVNEFLRTIPYLTNSGETFGLLYKNKELRIYANFFNMDPKSSADWLRIVKELKLKENIFADGYKFGMLKVPVGKEKRCVEVLKKQPKIMHVGLNSILE